MKKAILYFICICLVFISGCGILIRQRSLEELGLISVLGIDHEQGDQMKFTAIQKQDSLEAKQEKQLHTTVAPLVHEAFLRFSSETEKTITPSLLKVILFSEEVARKKGLLDSIQGLYRDSRISSQVSIAIVKGSTNELLAGKYPDKQLIDEYLDDLLAPRREMAFHPFTTIHDYIFHTTSKTADSLVPYIEKQGTDIKVTKTALFRGNRMVGFLNHWEGTIVQALKYGGELPSSKFEVKTTRKEDPFYVMLDVIDTDSDIKLVNRNIHEPIFKIKLKVSGNLIDYKGKKDLENEKELIILEQALAQEVKKRIQLVINKSNQLYVDPIGFTEKLRANYHGKWKGKIGDQALRKAKYQINVSVIINSTGTIQ